MSSASSWQLLERHDFFSQHPNTFFVNPPADAVLPTDAWAWHIYAHARFVNRPNSLVSHTLETLRSHTQPVSMNDINTVLIFIPKEKKLTGYLLENVRSFFPVGIQVLLVGSKDVGIKSWANKTMPGFSRTHTAAIGNHCQLLHTQLEEGNAFAQEYGFSRTQIEVLGHTIEVSFLPGVFSEHRLDAGTQLLLAHLPTDLGGVICDFGCGSGIISKFLGTTKPVSELHLCDLSALAIAASQRTLATDLNCHYYLADGLPAQLPPCDWIISNPPFHQGKDTNYDITKQFIQKVATKLKSNGSLLIVFNQFLPWPTLLEDQFQNIRIVASNKSYKVALAKHPRTRN
ncbi:16S rRNA (guanine1207-N2)-methyltransferase [Idiomarinaceae bacterium HL-53]|nr:16S rRNA (guanine1207-N2)-methyltransferase [Idiomarinaceae bacterium HL-53]